MPMASANAQPMGTLSQIPVTPSGVALAYLLSATRVPSDAMVSTTDIWGWLTAR